MLNEEIPQFFPSEISKEAQQILREYAPSTILHELQSTYAPNGTPLESLMLQMMTSMGFEPSAQHIPMALGIFEQTIRQISQIRNSDREIFHSLVYAEPKNEHMIKFGQGLYNLSIESVNPYAYPNEPRYWSQTRLFMTGFLYTQEGDLVIKKVQKHDFGYGYRGRITKHYSEYKEKLEGDEQIAILDRVLSPTNAPSVSGAQLFGLFMSLASLGTHSSGIVHFIRPEYHPEIVTRQIAIAELQNKHLSPHEYRERKKQYKSERNRIYSVVDFESMLSSIGVTVTDSTFPGHISANIDDIMSQGYAHISRQDNQDRHGYWRTISEIYDAQLQ